MLAEGISARLRDQLSGFEESFLPASVEVWGRKPASGKSSASENLAHLARYSALGKGADLSVPFKEFHCGPASAAAVSFLFYVQPRALKRAKEEKSTLRRHG